MDFPISETRTLKSFSSFALSRSFNLNRGLIRLATGVVLHPGYASVAASIARFVSSVVESGTLAIISLVAGFSTSRYPLFFGSIHSPSI